MILTNKFDKAEKHASKIKKLDEIKALKKYEDEMHLESQADFIPPLPYEVFENSTDFFSSFLKDIFKNNDFEIGFINDKNNYFTKKKALSSSVKTVIKELYILRSYLLPKVVDAKKDNYGLHVSEDKCTLSIVIDISHVKSNNTINNFIRNFSPKIQMHLIDHNGYVETERFFSLNKKTQNLTIKIKYFLASPDRANNKMEV